MPEEIAERLARLADLTDAELTQLQKDLASEFDKIDKASKTKTPEQVEVMEQLASAADNVTAVQSERTEANEAADAKAAELRNRFHPVDGETPAETVETPPGVTDETDETDETDAELPIAAGATRAALPSIARVNAARGRQAPAGPPAVRASTRTIAQFNGIGLKSGDHIESRAQFDELMATKVQDMIRTKGTGERFIVASVITEYPEERKLSNNLQDNEAKFEAVAGREALLASGGICGPVAVDYDILVLSSSDEPLGDALPTFNADRGGVRYVLPPTFTGVGSSATSLWTNATDTTPGGSTKAIQTISCGSVQESYVTAIPTRLKFGNMQDRFFPELIAANTNLALANASRVKELFRLTAISANSTVVSSGQLLGATRDALATLDQACAALRYRSRLARNTPLHVIFPEWAKDMFRADLTREEAHQQDSGWNSLSVSDAQIQSLFDDRGVNVTWMLDGQAAVTAAPAAGLQGFAAQSANVTLNGWPTSLVWWLYPEGTFQRIDGGEMNFGVIRDSTLDATNDYETMIEVFENVIYRGFESLEIVSAVRPNGASAGQVVTATTPVVY